MMSRIILAISISIFCAITINAQTKETGAGAAIVTGTITSNGQPVRGAVITLLFQSVDDKPNSNRPSARSDQSGNYRFTGLKAGRYYLRINAPPLILRVKDGGDGKTIYISDSENIENLNFELERGGVITGTITGPDGRPAVEANIDFTKVSDKGHPEPYWNGGNWEMRQTDDRGVYRLYGLPIGKYRLSVGLKGAPGSIHITRERQYFPKTYYGDTDDETKAKLVDITEESEATDIDIRLKEVKKFQKVHGRITDIESGVPVSGLQLSIGSVSKDEGASAEIVRASGCCSETSNENGEFQFNSVLPGKYTIFYGQNRFGDTPKSQWNSYISVPALVEVTESDVYGIEVKLLRGSTIKGNIIIEGSQSESSKLSGLRVHAQASHDQNNANLLRHYSAITGNINADGSFVLNGITPGKTTLRLDSNQFIVDRIEYNGTTILPNRNEGIDVTSGSIVSGVRLILHTRGTLQLNGEIKIINGSLPENLVVRPMIKKLKASEGSSWQSRYVDDRGKFIINNLSEGEYEVALNVFSRNNNTQMDKNIQQIIRQVKQIVTVTSGPPQTIILTVDLGGQN